MAGNVKPITAGNVTGSAVVDLDGYLFGGFDLNCDGTNAGTVVVRDENSSGTILIDTSSITGKTVLAPIHAPSGKIYYTVAGTGASAMFYEWNE